MQKKPYISILSSFGRLFFITLLIIVYLISADDITAKTLIYSEDFSEESALENWQIARNRQWNNSNQPCKNLQNDAEWVILDGEMGIEINGPGCTTEIIPTNFHYSLEDNFIYEFDWHLKGSTSMDRNALFKWQNSDNWYDFKLLGNSILMQKVVGGQVHNLEGQWGSYPFVANTHYHFEIHYIAGIITLYIDGNQVMQIIDQPPFLSGHTTFGLQASSGSIQRSISFFDNLKIYTLDEIGTQLSIEKMKQTDPKWADKIYNHATQWHQTKHTIQDWGCAISSIAMIFNYHGLDTMPDSSRLNPETLNTWLTSQTDGYIFPGLVNWGAIMRLSKIISDTHETQKLEYQRMSFDSNLDNLKQQIDNNLAPILHLPGHFIVANGYQDLQVNILDPYWDYNLLSEHQSTPLNMRLLTPTNSDLSYLVIAHPPEIKINMDDASSFSEQIIHQADSSIASDEVKIIEIIKPESGKYHLQASIDESADLNQDYHIQIFAYSRDANLSDLSITNLNFYRDYKWIIDFSKDDNSQITEVLNNIDLNQDLNHLRQNKQLSNLTFLRVSKLLKHASDNSEYLENYKQAILRELEWYQQFNSEETISKLRTKIKNFQY